jgi:hypothetical protein
MVKFPIVLSMAADRDDKGQTENYRVYSGGGLVQLKNKRGETIQKNALLGGNGTLYLANEISATHDQFVLLPMALYKELMNTAAAAKGKAAAASRKKE